MAYVQRRGKKCTTCCLSRWSNSNYSLNSNRWRKEDKYAHFCSGFAIHFVIFVRHFRGNLVCCCKGDIFRSCFIFFALKSGIKEHKLNTGKEIVSLCVGMVATQSFLLNTNVLPVGLLFCLFSDVLFVRIIHFFGWTAQQRSGRGPREIVTNFPSRWKTVQTDIDLAVLCCFGDWMIKLYQQQGTRHIENCMFYLLNKTRSLGSRWKNHTEPQQPGTSSSH